MGGRAFLLIALSLSLLSVSCGERDESPFTYPLNKVAGMFQQTVKESDPAGTVERSAGPGEEEPDVSLEDVELPFVTEHFYYEAKGRRDPFEPLITATGETPGLNINNVTLVGTMWGPGGMLALVKEKGGVGHVLKQGDRVAGGRVTRVTQGSITFEMDQFGVVTEVTFQLKGEE